MAAIDFASLLSTGSMLVSGVLFIGWLFQAHRSVRVDPEQRRKHSGWAIGGWFVPLAMYVIPAQVTADVFRGAAATVEQERHGWSAPNWRPLLAGWWAAWLLTSLLGGVSGVLIGGVREDADPIAGIGLLRNASIASTLQGLTSLVAALLLIWLIHLAQRMLRPREGVAATLPASHY